MAASEVCCCRISKSDLGERCYFPLRAYHGRYHHPGERETGEGHTLSDGQLPC
jgi:hypothetical protein